jgi:nitrate/nitrite transporter NarK
MGMGVLASQLARQLGGALSTSDHASVVSINLFVALLCACIVLGHLLEENRWLNESITALIIVSSLSLFHQFRLNSPPRPERHRSC